MADITIRQEKMRNKIKTMNFEKCLEEQFCRNSLVFYREDGVISKFKKSDRVHAVVEHKQFETDREDLVKSGRAYDMSQDFFHNYAELYKSIALPNVLTFAGTENSDFSDVTVASKNAYLSNTVVNNCENVLYSMQVKDYGINVLNSLLVRSNNENIYMCAGVIKSFNIFYSRYIYNSSNIRFCANMTGCAECIRCDGLENQSYCIENRIYAKEEYLRKKSEILQEKSKFLQRYRDLPKLGNIIASDNVKNSNFVLFSSNIDNGSFVYQVNNGRNLVFAGGIDGDEDMYNCLNVGSPASNHFYGVVNGGLQSENVYCSYGINTHCTNIYYSFFLEGCSYCLGCVGLKNKSFCILNKEYPKEERLELASNIFAQMDETGILGDYFPGRMNPYYFNDTVAYLINDSFTKAEVTSKGYLRRDNEIKVDIPTGSEVVKTSELSQYQGLDSEGKRQINPEILKKVIVDEKGNSYRIIKMEYDFLMKYGLPLPELHWLDRIKLGFKFK